MYTRPETQSEEEDEEEEEMSLLPSVQHFIALSALWLTLLLLSSYTFNPGESLVHLPTPPLPLPDLLRRRLLDVSDKVHSDEPQSLIEQAKAKLGIDHIDIHKQTQEFFKPNPDLLAKVDSKLADREGGNLKEAFYPFNLSGSYRGAGWMNYTETNNETVEHKSLTTATVLRIRTFRIPNVARYHQAQIRIMLTPDPPVSTKVLMLQASGLYDTLTGEMQAVSISGGYDPAKLPAFRDLNLTFPERPWPVASKGNFHPSKCEFLVDVVPDSITEDAHKKEMSGHDGSSDRRGGFAYSAIMDREYIDVHVKTWIKTLNSTCTNVTMASTEADLLRYDLFILKATKYALIATCLSFVQLLLLFRQMQYSTPASAAQKLSLASIAMHSVFDAYLCLIHLTTGLYIDDLFNSFIMVSFLQFMVFSMFDLRLVLLVWRARHPLDFSTGWETMRSTLTKIYSGFYGGVFLCLIFYYSVRHRMNHWVFLLFAFWIPQIIRNVRTGEKFALQEHFLYGVTAIRLFFPLYAFGCPQNFLEFPTNIVVVIGLLTFAGLQVLMLKGQDKWGSRFFIPKRFQPDYYEYHRTFQADPDDDESCAICMTEFAANDPSDPEKKPEKEDLRKKVLTTPCNHHFCRECLTRWMETKMICPTCRQPLPPYTL